MPPRYLDPRLSSLLENLRGRIRRYVVWDSLLAVAAVVLAAFWIGLSLDYVPVQLGGTEMPRLARSLLLLIVAAIVVAIVVKMLVGRLRRPLPDDSLALLVERHHPSLGGRLVTAVQLNRSDRQGDSHSPELLEHVHGQAAEAIDKVDPNRVFRWQPLVRKALVAGPLAILSLGLLIISPQSFAKAASRLTLLSDEPWPRRAHLEMVGVELPVVSADEEQATAPNLLAFDQRVLRLPRGCEAALRIRAADDEAELPVVCTVYYRTDAGTRGQSNMRRVGRVIDGYQSFLLDGPPLSSLSDSFTFEVRGLDDRLEDYRIESIAPPALSEMKVRVKYPDYLRLATDRTAGSDDTVDSGEVDMETDYQSGLRIREGSDVTLVAKSTVPLGDTDLLLKSASGQAPESQLTYSDDRRELRLTIKDFSVATTVSLVPRDSEGISAQAPYRYFLGVVLDEPPELQVRLKGIGSAVTSIARIPVEAVVVDDYGVEKLNISATPQSQDDDAMTATVSPPINRDGEAQTELDLRDLSSQGKLQELTAGSVIQVIVEASDRYDLAAPHLTRSEVFRLEIVTPEKLLSLLERRELALRSRLEQTIEETRNLRNTLNLLRRGFDDESQTLSEVEATRQLQVRRLRVQQSGLQANKTSEELSGIAASLDDILGEMVNNRVDSIDRRQRIGRDVRDPIISIVDGPYSKLQDQIVEIDVALASSETASAKAMLAINTSEEVLLRLTAVLEKMLDLESYNEILDMFRELIGDQEKLLEETQTERKKKVLELFK